MTSKRELQRRASVASKNYNNASNDRYKAQRELDAFQAENAALAHDLEHIGQHVSTLSNLLDDILVIEPQLKHLLTFGVWDFERIHRAAEVLRGEDALESVGYTTSTAFPENVTPIRPTDPRNGQGAA